MPTTHKPTGLFYTSARGDYLVTVAASEVESVWPRVAPLLEPAIVYALGTLTLEEVKAGLIASECQLWLAERPDGEIDGAWCTRIAGDSCEVILAGGKELDRWMPDLFVPVEWFAAEQGCKRVRIFGRGGWLRVLPGFQEVYRVIEKEVKDGR